jgi:hypothetical protein
MTFYEAVVAVILLIGYYTIYKNNTSRHENCRKNKKDVKRCKKSWSAPACWEKESAMTD